MIVFALFFFCNLRVRAPRYQIIPPETDLNLPPLLHNIREKVLPIAAVRTGKGTTLRNVWIIRIFIMTSEYLFSFFNIIFSPKSCGFLIQAIKYYDNKLADKAKTENANFFDL